MGGSANQSYGAGVTFVLLATLGWSLSGLFVRLMPGLDGLQINTWRGFWMAVALLVWLIARYGGGVFRAFAAIPPLALIISAGFFAFGSTFYVTSLTLVGTAVISVIGATSPLFTGLLSPWTTGERPSLFAWMSALLAVAGVAVIAWDELAADNIGAILVCLLVPFSFAGQTLALRRYRDYDMVPAICLGGFATFIAAGLLGFARGHPGGGFGVTPYEIALLAVMGPVQLAAPLIWFARGAKSVPAITLSLIVMLDVLLNPLWPWLFAGETPGRAAVIGGAIVLGAVLISIFGERAVRRRSE